MTYLVSVIIPLYNEEMHIKQNLNSLINQTIKFENIEVLLIDHCSTDNTLNIIKQLENKSENIKVVHLKENTGTPGNPRNAGINKASSDYIMFLDADDYYLNDICETLYRKIKKEDVDFVSCLYCFNTKTNIKCITSKIIAINKFFTYLSKLIHIFRSVFKAKSHRIAINQTKFNVFSARKFTP